MPPIGDVITADLPSASSRSACRRRVCFPRADYTTKYSVLDSYTQKTEIA